MVRGKVKAENTVAAVEPMVSEESNETIGTGSQRARIETLHLGPTRARYFGGASHLAPRT